MALRLSGWGRVGRSWSCIKRARCEPPATQHISDTNRDLLRGVLPRQEPSSESPGPRTDRSSSEDPSGNLASSRVTPSGIVGRVLLSGGRLRFDLFQPRRGQGPRPPDRGGCEIFQVPIKSLVDEMPSEARQPRSAWRENKRGRHRRPRDPDPSHTDDRRRCCRRVAGASRG